MISGPLNVHNAVEEDDFTESVVYLKSMLLQKKSSLLDNTMAITSSQRNLHTLKKMMDNLHENINSLYEKSSKKSTDVRFVRFHS